MNSILIVDDDKNLCDMLVRILSKAGYKTRMANDGEVALKEIAKEMPDIVLLDLFLPGMDGMAVLERIRKVDLDLNVIILTGYGNVQDAVQAMKLGAFDFIAKPVGTDELLINLKRACDNINLRRAQQKLKASRAKYFDLYDLAPVGYLTLSEQGLILEANLAAAKLIGLERSKLVKQPLTGFIVRDDQDIFCGRRQQLFETGAPQMCELRMARKDGAPFWVHLEAVVAQGGRDAPMCWITLSDITARRQAEERLERVNRCLLSLGSDFDANVNRITALCGEMLGGTCALYNRLEGGMLCVLGQWRIPPDFKTKDNPEGHVCYDVIGGIAGSDILFVPHLLHSRYAETDPYVCLYGFQSFFGHAVRCGDKSMGSLCVVFRHLFNPTEADKHLLGILASAIGAEENRRLTVRALLESEKTLQVERLNFQRMNEERKYLRQLEMITRDLHDGIGGITAIIGLMAEIGQRQSTTANDKGQFKRIVEQAAEASMEVRELVNMLESREFRWSDLIVAFRRQGEIKLESHCIAFNLTADGDCAIAGPGLVPGMSLLRILKEALTNVIKHSGADRVDLALSFSPEQFRMSVHDNGRGLDQRQVQGRGLANMRKRAADLGGTMNARSEGGTHLEFEFPIPLLFPEQKIADEQFDRLSGRNDKAP